ncbi:hypothetical protein NPIL_138101 [Nephila pilipes]|uniref:Uncharacterized protein n=1 Tax=Nephila pilipes TaxID=299642 RepID=A0A8X6QEE4_NEPPI|nr:hypothetical protein NPIL_138101 [Nephila pilipes]
MTLREKEIDVFSIMGANLTCENPKYYSFKGYSLYVFPKLTNEAEERVQDFLNPSTFELVYNKEDPHTYLYHNGRRFTPEQLMRFADLYKFTKGAILKDPGSVHRQVTCCRNMLVSFCLSLTGTQNHLQRRMGQNPSNFYR